MDKMKAKFLGRSLPGANLTVGKVYEVEDRGKDYTFQDDIGDWRWRPKACFRVIPEEETPRPTGFEVIQEATVSGSKTMTLDPINPEHYSRWKIQPIDFIMANNLPFWLGNVVKYGMRFDAKDGLQDLKKAREYLDRKIAEMEAKLSGA